MRTMVINHTVNSISIECQNKWHKVGSENRNVQLHYFYKVFNTDASHRETDRMKDMSRIVFGRPTFPNLKR